MAKKRFRDFGLSENEYTSLVAKLGREPTNVELAIIGALWSEHCSYKSSKIYLSSMPRTGERVVVSEGENAGAVELDDELVAIFKVESHNHPSYIEPYQGAATGVGGILRDIFTMGARPIALMDQLFFGESKAPKMSHLVSRVVKGIGDYGNRVGVPTVGGMVYVHRCYNFNILVNVFALGITSKRGIFSSKAKGLGNYLLYVGNSTGLDGVKGAIMASDRFSSENSRDDILPTVQIGDPFVEKLLIEATLEALSTGYVVALQDMGAAGLSSSSYEMAAKGDVGFVLDLDRVPLREENLTPEAIMLSETQERMLLVVMKDKVEEVKNIFNKWGVPSAVVGKITDDRMGKVLYKGSEIANIPVYLEPPVYKRAVEPYVPPQKPSLFPPKNGKEVEEIASTLVSTPEIANKEWIFSQYDYMVRTNTVIPPGSDAALLRIKKKDVSLAITSDVNPAYCFLDPFIGTLQAIAEAARNLASVGAEPLGVTNCLNFGNPEDPKVMWQFARAVDGISTGCKTLGIPVVSGNVSFYNQTDENSVYPTPTIVMVGIKKDGYTVPNFFRKGGEKIVAIGALRQEEFGGSLYQRYILNKEGGRPPTVDLKSEIKINDFVRFVIKKRLITSVHDISEGGLLLALLEMSFPQSVGFTVAVEIPAVSLFSESQGVFIVTCEDTNLDRLCYLADSLNVHCSVLGDTVDQDLWTVEYAEGVVSSRVSSFSKLWNEGFSRYFALE